MLYKNVPLLLLLNTLEKKASFATEQEEGKEIFFQSQFIPKEFVLALVTPGLHSCAYIKLLLIQHAMIA